MILVFIFLSIFVICFFSKIMIKISNISVSKKNKMYDVSIYFVIFDFLPIKIKMFKDIDNNSTFSRKNYYCIKNVNYRNIKIKKLKVYIDINTDSTNATIILVTILNIYLSFLYKKIINSFDSKKYKYEVKANYGLKNDFLLNINGIAEIKTLDIIKNIILRRKDERTSNRKFNENCHE